MKATFYLPYSVGDPINGFKYDDPTFTDRKYIEIMTEDYNRYKDSVDLAVNNNFGRSGNAFFGTLTTASHNKIKRQYTKQTYQYNHCPCIIRDIKGNDESIDNLLRFYKNGEQFIIILKLLDITSNPDLESDVKAWIKESNHINFSSRLTDEEKIYNLPKKDFKITFENAKSSAICKECKIFESYSPSEHAILVNKILFVMDNKR